MGTNAWFGAGGRLDFAGDAIAVFLNGVKESDSSVTFANNTFTLGTPSGDGQDVISGNVSPPIPLGQQTDGDIAEMAYFTEDIGDNAFIGLGHGVNPFTLEPAVYFALHGNESPENDLSVNSLTGTITGSIPKSNHAGVELLENSI